MAFNRKNALDQALDIAGSLLQEPGRNLAYESLGLGRLVSGSSAAADFGTPDGNNIQTIQSTALNLTLDSTGRFLRVVGAFSGSNNGTFLIVSASLPLTASVLNAAGQPEVGNTVTLEEHAPYSLEDDINFARSDRAYIKGVAFDAAVPSYQRPTAVGTNVSASLANIAGKTTDAKALVTTRAFLTGTMTSGTFFTVLNDTGMFPHADSVDRTGVPVIDGADAGATEACYVEIINLSTEAGLEVLSGAFAGQRIFGLTFGSSGSEPDSVGVQFMRVAKGGNIADGVPYAWEDGQPLTASFFYGFRQRIDQLDDAALRRVLVNGVIGDADMVQDIIDIRSVVGVGDNVTNLSGLLTNTGNFFPFVNLPDATPSVVEALNTLNAQIGNRDYTGVLLTDGQTITASLQALANAIAASSCRRIIERLAVDASANVAHTLPGGATYVPGALSGSGFMFVFVRGLLWDPGSVVNFDNYAESSTTEITPFSKIKAGDHVNYFIY